MKISSLLALAIVFAVVMQGLAQNDLTNCSANQNPFREVLHSQLGLQFLPAPVKNTGKCGSEWSTYGTCCNETQLESMVSKDNTNIEAAVSKLIGEFQSMATLVSNHLINLLKQKVANLRSNWEVEKAKFNSSDIEKLNELAKGPSLNSFYYSAANATTAQFSLNLKKCWQYQASLRSSAVCSTCSANSKRFFDANLGLANMHVCDKLVDICRVSVLQMNRLIYAFNALIDNDDLLRRAGILINTKERVRVTEFKNILNKYVSQSPDLDIAENRLNFTDSLRQDSKRKAEYCSYMLRLNLVNTPYVVAFSRRILTQTPWTLNGQQISPSDQGSRLLSLTFDYTAASQMFDKPDTEFLQAAISNVSFTNHQTTITAMDLDVHFP